MSIDVFETVVDENIVSPDGSTELNLNIKLERRRRIEELFEEKRLREELAEFDWASVA